MLGGPERTEPAPDALTVQGPLPWFWRGTGVVLGPTGQEIGREGEGKMTMGGIFRGARNFAKKERKRGHDDSGGPGDADPTLMDKQPR